MTNKSCKLYLFFLILYVLFYHPSYSQGNNFSLTKADNLFKQHRYTESFRIYNNILTNQQQYSPQMLLKMAYIQELQKNYTASLYYLQLYYNQTPNRTVLKKMEDLAKQQDYSGYEYSDFEFFQTQFNKHYFNILQLLLMIAVAMGTILVINFRKQKIPGLPFRIVFLLYLLFIAYYINFLNFGKKGIIQHNNIAIMSAPSAAASWIATTGEGHKINLKGELDIWYETEWQGRKAYIRKKNVLELP